MTQRIGWIFGLLVSVWFPSSGFGQVLGDFPEPKDTETVAGEPMAPEDAARSIALPDGFQVTVFAAEPDVRNPIACAWDAKGRLWVAENYTYGDRTDRFDLSLRDRVLILDDANGDGRMDHRTVFTEDVQVLTSVEVGHGGVWLMCPPQLLFIPDRDGDDRPDGPAEVVLDGFDVPPENYHNFANGLRWGPDGWLYGRCGGSSPGRIGRPGTPDAHRVPLNGTIWRYHPTRRTVEVLASGTTNPWGHDWNALGELFFINTVNGHLWHLIPGAHYVRPFTMDPSPHAYAWIDQHADHWHWDTRKDWTDSRSSTGEHDTRGGGHAHIGMMVYEGTQWPEEYRGKLMTLNMHGRRVNVESLEREGSGYVGRHAPDILKSGDPFFRGMELTYGPDGGVYILDWSDTGECHEYTGVHRSSGRIYKVTYGEAEPARHGDLVKYRGKELAELQAGSNEWMARQARRILAERVAEGHAMSGGADILRTIFETNDDPVVKVRALCALHGMNKSDPTFLRAHLNHPHESVRAWAIRLLTDSLPMDLMSSQRPPDRVKEDVGLSSDLLEELAQRARTDESGLVRLVLASTLQRLPVEQRPTLAGPLLARAEDANDHNLPLMLWYGLIPVAEENPNALATLVQGCALPMTRQLMVRRLTERVGDHPEAISQVLTYATTADEAFVADVVAGLTEGLKGRRQAMKPASWGAFAARLASAKGTELANRGQELSIVFGDGRALESVKALAMDTNAPLETRRSALKSLIEARPNDLRSICEQLLSTRYLNTTAVGGLALFDDPEIGARLAASYRSFQASERGAVLDALVSRASFAEAMLNAMAEGRIPRGDLTAFHARRIRNLGDDRLNARLSEVWGELRDSPSDRRAMIERWKETLGSARLAEADLGRGRLIFNEQCANCHRLYGQGGEIGPDLTGAGRTSIDYVLENVIDPAAVVTADFRMRVLGLTDGRVLNGIVLRRDDRTLTLQTDKEQVVLPLDEIEEERVSDQSLMPEGLIQSLSEDQVRDLVGYLMHPTQVPLPE